MEACIEGVYSTIWNRIHISICSYVENGDNLQSDIICCSKRMVIFSLYLKTAFLHGKLNENAFCRIAFGLCPKAK